MTETKRELLPCPFCGSKNISLIGGVVVAFIKCEDCTAGFNKFKTREEAMAAWNRRSKNEL